MRCEQEIAPAHAVPATPLQLVEYELYPNDARRQQSLLQRLPSTVNEPGLGDSDSTMCDQWLYTAPDAFDETLFDQATTYNELCRSQRAALLNDHVEFYSGRSLATVAMGFGIGALMANTSFDENVVRNTYIDNIILAPEDDLYEMLHEPKYLGEGQFTVPIFAAAALAEPLIGDCPGGAEVSEWGQRSLRTLVVGAPPMLALQFLTGGSRPGESSASSRWKPLQDSNGVSGHAFMGAIPLISAAKMTDNFWLKSGLYAASTLPAVSRVNDDAHYFSQAFLGWWLAYMAASAVDRTENLSTNFQMQPVIGTDRLGWMIQVAY